MKLSKIIGDPEKFIDNADTTKILPMMEFEQKYEIQNQIGIGSLSRVEVVKEKETGTLYTAKVIERNNIESAKQLWGYIQILSHINQPNLVHLHFIYGNDSHLILLTDYAKNGNLLTKLQSIDSYTESNVAKLIETVLTAILYLHENKICDANLKPENLLFLGDDLKISDYGLYKIMKYEAFIKTTNGNAEFLPPELFWSKEPSMESDIWNIGVLTYFLLTGTFPFKGTPYQRFQAIASCQADIGDDLQNFSDEVKDFITKCLQNDPKKRLKDSDALSHGWFCSPGTNPIQKDAVVAFLVQRKQTSENPELATSLASRILSNRNKVEQNEEATNENGEDASDPNAGIATLEETGEAHPVNDEPPNETTSTTE